MYIYLESTNETLAVRAMYMYKYHCNQSLQLEFNRSLPLQPFCPGGNDRGFEKHLLESIQNFAHMKKYGTGTARKT